MTGSPAAGEPSSRLRRHALVLVGAGCYTALTFVWFSLPAYLPSIIADVGLSGTQAGLLAGAVPLTYIPLGLAAGLVVDRIGPVRSLAGGLLVFGSAQVTRSVAGGFAVMLLATLAIGVGATVITFGLPKLVGVLYEPDRTGLPTSFYLVGGSAGTALAFAVGRPILGPALGGWRPLFFWSGLAAVGYALVWLLAATMALGRDRYGGSGDPSSLQPSRIREDLTTLLSHRDLRLLVVVATVYLLVVHGIQGWLPTVLDARGLTADLAGLSTSLFVGATIVAVLLVPAVADRLDARREAIIVSGALAFVGLASVVAGGAGPLALGGIVVAGFGAGGLSPLVRAIPPTLPDVGARLTGTAMGLTFAVGEIGGVTGPLLIGALHDLTGSYGLGLSLVAAAPLLVVGAGLAMRNV